jgi:REP element-mobilizing transposase RayT
MELGKTYFYTSTIVEWKSLLENDIFKDTIIQSLEYRSNKNLINVYGFVIMPNHIHIIIEMLKMNGKEKPIASLMKVTSHQFKKMLTNDELINFKVDRESRNYQFWQRDPLPIELYSREVIEQKLDYIHNNPIQGKWSLCNDIIDYKYSSATYYELDRNDFGFMKHYIDRIM